MEDGGGPIIPKVDCPHLGWHVKFGIVGGVMKLVIGGDGKSQELGLEFRQLCLERNLMTSKCQHGGVLRKRVSQKRLRI